MPDLPSVGADANAWGPKVNAYLVYHDGQLGTLATDVSTVSSVASAASTAASAATAAVAALTTTVSAKADATNVYTKTAGDLRYVRSINSSTPDVNGNVTVSPEPGVQEIRWDPLTGWPLRATKSNDNTQRVEWVSPIDEVPPITAGYAVDGVDSWLIRPDF